MQWILKTRVRVWRERSKDKEYRRYIITIPREIGELLGESEVEVIIKKL